MPYKDIVKRRERQKEYSKEYSKRPEVQKRRARYWKEYYIKRPWAKSLKHARRRCTDKKNWYYQQGIKCLLTLKDMKFLWSRDRATEMKEPSIDRLNGGHYTRDNCRFIELKQNKSRDKWRGKEYL